MAVIDRNSKDFELPPSRQYYGRIIDVVEFKKDTVWQGTVKRDVPHVTIVWVLNAVDSEGRPFRAQVTCPQSMDERSTLYKTVSGILGTAPPVPFDTETLIGVANLLYIQQEKSKDGTKTYANIKTIMPVMKEQMAYVPKGAPEGFVRDVNHPAAEQKRNRVQSNGHAPVAAAQPQPASQAAPAPQFPVNQSAPSTSTVQF